MATSGNWSVVGKQKKGKPQSQQQQQLSKQQKKQFIESMPRIEAAGKLQVKAFTKKLGLCEYQRAKPYLTP